MITTPDLINSLVAHAEPVQRLRAPVLRSAGWLLFAALIFLLLGVSHGLRPDIAQRLEEGRFVVGTAASLLTGILAVVAAFLVSLPGRSQRWLLLPLPGLVVWAGTVGYGCLTDWVSIGPNGLQAGEALRCFATLVLTSVPLSLALVLMLRYAALFRPTLVVTLGSLAVAALAASALSLFHSLEATAMILMWNFGVAALLVGAGSLAGRRMFAWVAPASLPLHG
ncbi:MAG: DUF1109 domain-containing protein [Betaproteobacteria bacterium]|nr:DUF1109 domain-containing protein [Betaproteobacteria bacterium]